MVTEQQAHRWAWRYGGVRPAARALGIPPPTLRRWLDPEKQQEYEREWYRNLSGYGYNRLLFRHRRNKALQRIAKRQQRQEEEPDGALST